MEFMRAYPIVFCLGNWLDANSCCWGQMHAAAGAQYCTVLSQVLRTSQVLRIYVSCFVHNGEFKDVLLRDLPAAAGHVGTSPD